MKAPPWRNTNPSGFICTAVWKHLSTKLLALGEDKHDSYDAQCCADATTQGCCTCLSLIELEAKPAYVESLACVVKGHHIY